jgi:hypothetical protein
METIIKEKIKKLSDNLGKQIIAVVYNPCMKEGMKESDCFFLKFLLKKARYTAPLFILSGRGGDYVPGVLFPYLILDKVKNYKTYVPLTCGSALCYTLIKSSKLYLGKNAKITQIDPTFEYRGESLRAINHLRSMDPLLRRNARDTFNNAKENVAKLSEPPSIFKFEVMNPKEFQHQDDIATYFMNKDEHETPLTKKELGELEVNFQELSEEIDNLSEEFIQVCQDFTIKKEVRVIFVSSIPLKMEKEKDGRFICPLK